MMAVIDRRMTAEMEGDFLVFLIGMHFASSPTNQSPDFWVPTCISPAHDGWARRRVRLPPLVARPRLRVGP